MHKIPKKIHQIWVGNYEIPEQVKICISSVKEKFDDFEYIFWNNDNIPDMPKNVYEQFNKYGSLKIPAFQADILRLYVLNAYGGIFLDADFLVRENFYETITKPFWCVIANETTRRHVFNGIFACEPNNPILTKLLSEMKDEPLGGKGLQGHGPLLLSNYIRDFAKIPKDYNIYQHLKSNPHDYIQCDSHMEFENGRYTKHYFLGSSKLPSAWKNNL